MTEGKNFKRRVRTRMDEAGETYTEAYAALESEANDPGRYATLGLTSEDVARYRRAMAGLSLQDIARMWTLDIDAELFAAYAEAGFDARLALQASVAQITADEAAQLAAFVPPHELAKAVRYATTGLRPGILRAYLEVAPTIGVDGAAELFTGGVTPGKLAQVVADTADTNDAADAPAPGELPTSDDPGDYAALGITAADITTFRASMPALALEEIGSLWVLGVRPERFAAYQRLGFSPEVMQVAAVVNLSPEEAADLIELVAPDEVRQGIDYVAIGLRPQHLRAYRDSMADLSLADAANLFTMGVRPDRFADRIARGMTIAEMLDEAAVGPKTTTD